MKRSGVRPPVDRQQQQRRAARLLLSALTTGDIDPRRSARQQMITHFEIKEGKRKSSPCLVPLCIHKI